MRLGVCAYTFVAVSKGAVEQEDRDAASLGAAHFRWGIADQLC
jgi:hypothetical protein